MSPFQKYPHLFNGLSKDEQALVAELWADIYRGDEPLLAELSLFLERLLAHSVGINFLSLATEERPMRCLEYLMVGLRLRVCTFADVCEFRTASLSGFASYNNF